MRLFIHFGIYKTASSFLQHVCAVNREYLRESGFHFPMSRYDDLMLHGLITPGNAGRLHRFIELQDREAAIKLIGKWVRDARSADCTAILISAESLIHVFAKENALVFLEQVAAECGVNQIRALGYFRNLADHALSTFKHRAKTGKIKDFRHWVANVYETPVVLAGFLKQFQTSKVHWSLRKFRKDSNAMISSFFQDWLNVSAPEKSVRPTVNESLSLSEILVMQELAIRYKSVMDYFVEPLKTLSKTEKADDRALEALFFNQACEILAVHQPLLNSLNAVLAPGEELEIEVSSREAASTIEEGSRLSIVQARVILKSIEKMNTISGQLIQLRRKTASVVSPFFFPSKDFWR